MSLLPTTEEIMAGFERAAAAWNGRFTGRLICALGTIDYEGEIGKQTTFTVTTSYANAQRMIKAASKALTPAQPEKRTKANDSKHQGDPGKRKDKR